MNNWLDILILAVLGLAAFKGFRRGLVREVIDLAGAVLAIYLGFRFVGPVATWLAERGIASGTLALVAGFIVIVFGTSLLGGLISSAWGAVVRFTPVSWVDSLGGAGFALAKAGVLALVVLLLLTLIPFPALSASLAESSVAQFLLGLAPGIYAQVDRVLPADVPRLYIGKDGIWLKTSDGGRWPGASGSGVPGFPDLKTPLLRPGPNNAGPGGGTSI